MNIRLRRDTVIELDIEVLVFAAWAVVIIGVHLALLSMEVRTVSRAEFAIRAVALYRNPRWIVGFVHNRYSAQLVRTRNVPGLAVQTPSRGNRRLAKAMRVRAERLRDRAVLEALLYLTWLGILWSWPWPVPWCRYDSPRRWLASLAHFTAFLIVLWTIAAGPLCLCNYGQPYRLAPVERPDFEPFEFARIEQQRTATISYSLLSQAVLFVPIKGSKLLGPYYRRLSPLATDGQIIFVTGALLCILLAIALWLLDALLTLIQPVPRDEV